MGKDAKNRQKGGGASSSRAAELLQSSGVGIQFLSLGGNPADANFEFQVEGGGQSAEEFGDVEPEMRVAFRKLTKRESNTREKGLRTLIEAVERTTGDSAATLNGIRHFVPFYQSLVLDGVSGVRVVANECLAAVITKFQKQAAEHIVKMLPYTLLSVHDHLAAVRKSAVELLEKCFTEEQRKKVDERAAPKAVKICLEMIRRKHNSLNKQKFEDVETHSQRTERIVLQAITTLTKLQAFAEDKAEVVKTLDETHDVVSKISDQIHGNLLACVLALIKGGSVAEVMSSPLAMKVIRFLDSEKPLLYRNAFGCYMYMAEAIASEKVQSIFTIDEFLHKLVLRMVEKKGSHFESLHTCLLPLVIIAIKYAKEQPPIDWIAQVLEAFFVGDVSPPIFESWCNTFIDVVDWLCAQYLPAKWNGEFGTEIYALCFKFLDFYAKRRVEWGVDVNPAVHVHVCTFLVRRTAPIGAEGAPIAERYVDDLVLRLVDGLPETSIFLGAILSSCAEQAAHNPSALRLGRLLKARLLESPEMPEQLFRKLLKSREYEQNEELDLEAFAPRLIAAFRTNNDDDLLHCCKFLKARGLLAEHRMADLIDVNDARNVRRLFSVFHEDGGAEMFAEEERLEMTRRYLQSADFEGGKAASAEFLAWIRRLPNAAVFELLQQVGREMRFDVFAKLTLDIFQVTDFLTEEQRKTLTSFLCSELITAKALLNEKDRSRLSDRSYSRGFALGDYKRHLPSVHKLDLDAWVAIAERVRGVYGAVQALEIEPKEIHSYFALLDVHFGEQLLLSEAMLGVVALRKEFPMKRDDRDQTQVMVEMLNRSVFCLTAGCSSGLHQLFVAVTWAFVHLYVDHVTVENEVTRAIPRFLEAWKKTEKWDWKENMPRLLAAYVESYERPRGYVELCAVYTLRRLSIIHDSADVVEYVPSFPAVPEVKLALMCGFRNTIPAHMLGEYSNSLLPFILSLERASERVKGGQDEENVALVVLSDLQAKVENEDIDWLFNANGEDMMKDALSCALMRLFVRLAHVVHELPPKIHELVLCGLVTICTNFVTNFRSDGLVRLLAMQGLEFFVKYDHSLTNQLAILRSSVVLSNELLERRSKLETTLQEWRDFFCATTAAHALAWFFWAGAGPNASPLPDFFRVHVAKILHHCDAEVGLFEVVRNPTPLLVAHLADGNEKTPTTAEVFAKLVDFLFSKEAALQLTAVHLLQRELIGLLGTQTDETEAPAFLGESSSALAEEGDERTEAEDRIEHKICRFFSALLDRFDADDQYFVESIDPSLVVADLLIRVVRLLDAKVAAVVCANLGDGKEIHRLFLRICKYLSFSAAPDVIKRNVQQTPAQFFSFWTTPVDPAVSADKAESITQRVMTIDGYACWLYRRALETLPAIVREWFVSVQNKPLQEFTKKFISPVLIENEMRNVEQQSSGNFSLRARPPTREIVARYQFEELRLEATISLPEDYPLSQVAVEHDKRNVLSKGMTKKIHLDLFAFVNNRNGSILDGILQWKQNVEKSTEGAEPCAICLSVVSSTNYRLPRLRCRKCHKKFHDDCMYKWIKTTDKPSCPLCRNVFT